MPTLTIYRQQDFPPLYKTQALAFMRCEWPSIFQGDNLYMSETYPPDLHPIHFAIAEGETLLSYATLLRRKLLHAGQTFDIYGFGNMLTFPPFRRQGFGRRILHSATEYIRQGQADVAILYCDASLEAYYAVEGWVAMRSETRLGHPEAYTVYDPIRMMLFVSAKGLANQAEFGDSPLYVDWPW